MTRRWIGGIFGNTVGSDTNVSNTTGVFSMEQQYYITQEDGWSYPPGSEQNPGQTAAQVAGTTGASSGNYYMQHPSARTGATGTYLNYCLFGDANKHHGVAWNLAMNIRFDQSNWKTYTGATKGTNTSAYHWNKWTVNSPENLSTNQIGSVDKFDYDQSCIGYGYFIPFTKIMIMSYASPTSSFSNPGATAYYSRSSSSGNLRDLLSGTTDTVWSTGGRQALYTAGNLSGPTYNGNRADQKFTGNPWTQTGNTYGAGSFSHHALDTFNIVFNTGDDSSSYKSNTGTDYNWSRITTTMSSTSLAGNSYQHTMQHGLGLLHSESGYGGSKMYSLGQDSYCDNKDDHTAANDYRFHSGSNAFCGDGTFNSTYHGFSIWVA
jgi:hypothetical protein